MAKTNLVQDLPASDELAPSVLPPRRDGGAPAPRGSRGTISVRPEDAVKTRRDFLDIAAAGLVGCAAPQMRGGPSTSAATPTPASPLPSRTIVGGLSGKALRVPDVNAPPMPAIGAGGIVHDGVGIGAFGIDPGRGYPDVRSHRKKLGLLIPATNTSMEHELWRIIFDNREVLDGVGLHATPIATPRPVLRTAADLDAYKRQFLGGLGVAIDQAMLAQPESLVLGMSLEHILYGIGPIRAVIADAESRAGAPLATWHDAAPAALNKLGAKRIGLLTPFDRSGNANATRMFEDLGFEVVSSVGFACANALHIAHIPDEAKERAITELLATPKNRLDAVVQCGTNMSMVDVTEKLEPSLKIPILGINAVTFWYALREHGITAPLARSGRLLREA